MEDAAGDAFEGVVDAVAVVRKDLFVGEGDA